LNDLLLFIKIQIITIINIYYKIIKALDSVKNSKEEDVQTIEDLGKLKGIGTYILGKFKKQLLEYQTKTGHVIIENLEINTAKEKKSKSKEVTKKTTNSDKPKRGIYIYI